MTEEKRTCLYCGEPIRGRLDKKFCDDQCRNTFNNAQKSISTNLMRNINNALKKNRLILQSFLPADETTAKTTRDRLNRQGFNYKYFTHTYETKKGSTYYYCYEYGYLDLGGDWFLIVKGKEN